MKEFFILASCLCLLILGCAELQPPKTIKDINEIDTSTGPSDTKSLDGLMKSREEGSSPSSINLADKRKEVSGLSAGFVDDNKQFNRFLAFLEDYKGQVEFYPIPVQERIILKVLDKNGKSLANVPVKVKAGNKILTHGLTLADGSFLFFPSEFDSHYTSYEFQAEIAGLKQTLRIERNGERELALKVSDYIREVKKEVPLDILFILDTTGSMGEEIARLKKTIEIIYANIALFSSRPKVRFGLVLYRDQGDDYVTKIVPLTENLELFQKELDQVKADGGGDRPEDLQSALKDAMTKISWNMAGIRLGFIITDAPPHLDYGQTYTYVSAAQDAKRLGIKLFSIGAGELNLSGEYILRQIAQYTSGKYIFLTYGEKDDSEGGKVASVSHHVGTNYQTDKLEAIVIQIAREELSYLTDQPVTAEEEYFAAVKIKEEEKAETLQKLFDMAFNQLVDYSSIRLKKGVRASVLPFTSSDKNLGPAAEYFTQHALLAVGIKKYFTLVERENLQAVLKELELQLSDLADETNAVRLGQILGAEVLISGKLYRLGENYEIFIKLIRLETAEILSVTKVKIDKSLGL